MGAYNDQIYDVATSFEGRHIPYGTGMGQTDCSHFVQNILERATGRRFEYTVANDYPRSGHFTRVDLPSRGDIVFWQMTPHGHVAVVLEPHTGLFIGSQSTHGVGTDHFTSSYWRHHGGGPQFYRYVG